MAKSQYEELGVDPGKENVRKAFGKRIDNDFPGAFVNIVRDPTHSGEVFTQHMDGDGSKFVQRLLIYQETGDESVISGAVDDALSMNLGDIAASGFTSGLITVTDVINVNGFNVPKDLIMEQIGARFDELKALYKEYGFGLYYFLGGETGDLPDQVQSVVFDIAVHARAKEIDIIRGNVALGDFIWGFASDGQAVWESEVNYGIMSNGLTLGRASTMWSGYTQKYPHLIRAGGGYNGLYKVGDFADGIPVDRALISPTRQWAILIKILLDKLDARGQRDLLHGISMNTGGGATKIGHVGQGILYSKEMPDPPAIFNVIQEWSKETWRDMFRGFNCGVGIDVVGDPALMDVLHEVEEETQVRLYMLGVCDNWKGKGNKVELITPFGEFSDY